MLQIDAAAKVPLYQQIYEQIRDRIVRGDYLNGERLPSTRELARQLCVGRNTVESAYAQLALEGYVASRVGSGFVVQELDMEGVYRTSKERLDESLEGVSERGSVGLSEGRAVTVQHNGAGEEAARKQYKMRDTVAERAGGGPEGDTGSVLNPGGTMTGAAEPYDAAPLYDFQCFGIEHSDFPYTLWKRLTAEVLSSLEAQQLSVYPDRKGDRRLRAEIVKYLREARGVVCRPEQVVLCGGTIQALDMVSRLFAADQRVVAFENPGYDGARLVFQNNGYSVVPVDVTADGLDEAALKGSGAKVAYVTPSHQFPMGVVMSIQQRFRLLQWAADNEAVIIEDDYDSEFRYRSRPIPALQSLDTAGRVVYAGTFSRSLAPGMRMGYMILPDWLLSVYERQFGRFHAMVPWIEQQVMCRFMERGHWGKHLRRACLRSRKRYDALVAALRDSMGDCIRVHAHNAGLHLLLEFLNGESEEWAIERAKSVGVAVYPASQFWLPEAYAVYEIPNARRKRPLDGPLRKERPAYVLLGFSKLTEEEIENGVRLLKKVWFPNG